MARHAGLLVPLFSVRSHASWGIGELPDLDPLAAWMSSAGFDRLMLLPLGTVTPGETSPYSAASAMAIDPIYVGVARLDDFVRAGGEAALSPEDRDALNAARRSRAIRYEDVRQVKARALDLAFDRFVADEWDRHTSPSAELADYIARERWWLDDYALHQAIDASAPGGWWREWEPPLRDRHPDALERARRGLARDVLRQQYGQWIAEREWQRAREAARRQGVTVFGDLPFIVNASSADVWARQGEFDLRVSVGVPPDAFSADGQNWGLPLYRWDVIARGGYEWIRRRARRTAALFDGVRIDHLVGLYRTYGFPVNGGEPFFVPAREDEQRQQGETVLRLFLESGAVVVAEDLGTVPDFVRDSLRALGVPGSKVLRWEREWLAPGRPFIDPAAFAPLSAALTGTHDTEPLADWWDHADVDDRQAAARLPVLEARRVDPRQGWTDGLRHALLEQAYRAGSDELFVPVQDVFGWRDRINTPGTVGAGNWTWTLPLPIDMWGDVPDAAERAAFCRALAERTGRVAMEGMHHGWSPWSSDPGVPGD
jgi:4-alpha-glucanotransferase